MNFSSLDELRAFRDSLLQKSDAYYLPDYPHLSNFDKIEPALVVYRQQLRDWPSTETDLANATVPNNPLQ